MSSSNPRAIKFVIPAAGSATRFNGIPKELLPINHHECGLTRAVRLAGYLGGVVPTVITTNEKHFWHRNILEAAGLYAEFITRPDQSPDMWPSVRLGIGDHRMHGGLIMPDTIAQVGERLPEFDSILFGCFETTESERFSCLDLSDNRNPTIRTKQSSPWPQLAWGLVVWHRDVSSILRETQTHYDRAFEDVMRQKGYSTFLLKSYTDIGDFEHYSNYLKSA